MRRTPRLVQWPLTVVCMMTLISAVAGCKSLDAGWDPVPVYEFGANPAAEGFDLEGSDAEAIEIADRVMEAMGGGEAWDETRYLQWNFFGRRRHLWDKHTGDFRIEWQDSENGAAWVAISNVHHGGGQVWRDGVALDDPAQLTEILERAKAWWINDSYWLVMPFKLKDSGVTLSYVEEIELPDGRAADVLELTFEAVGLTPRNKYRVFVARDTGLVEQWAFYRDRDDPDPLFTTPWSGWESHGNIWLSGGRGDGRQITEIATPTAVSATAFTSP